MAHLRTERVPASVAGHVWDDETSIVEVPDDLATELLRIPDARFFEVLPGDPKHPGTKPAAPRKATAGKARTAKTATV